MLVEDIDSRISISKYPLAGMWNVLEVFGEQQAALWPMHRVCASSAPSVLSSVGLNSGRGGGEAGPMTSPQAHK
jgi:hypothetical protein